MVEKCLFCGKEFMVLYPQLWAYKKGYEYLCSWRCLRALEKGEIDKMAEKKEGLKRGPEVRQECLRIALEGGNPLEYLRELKYADPCKTWYHIKRDVKESNPEMYAKLPKRVGMSPVESGRKARAVALEKAEKKKEKIRLIYDETERKAYEEKQAEEPAQEEPKTAAEAMQGMKDAADSFFGTYCPEEPAEAQETNETEEQELEYKTMGIQAEMGIFQYYKRTGYLDWTPNDPGADTVSLYVDEWRQLINDLPKIARILGVEL